MEQDKRINQVMNEQLDLIKLDPPLCRTRLEATDSPKRAYYEVSVYSLPCGFLVQKTSGGQTSKGQTEKYWRPGLKQALEKYAFLVQSKKNKKRGRIYIVIKEDGINGEKRIQ